MMNKQSVTLYLYMRNTVESGIHKIRETHVEHI